MADGLGKRIKAVLADKGISQAELARLVGVKQQTINYITQSDAGASRYAGRIAEALGVNPHWLTTGRGDPHDPTVSIQIKGVDVTVKRVPLLADASLELFLKKRKAPAGSLQLMTDAPISALSFALEIAGDSMQPIFKPGDRVVIDPEVWPMPGDFVAALTDVGVAFRKYRPRTVDEHGKVIFELVPLNDDWPSMLNSDMNATVVGVMVEHRSYRAQRTGR
jgi:SOS-response transcriptional repressor LexA